MAATPLEVTRDIVVAMIQKTGSSLGHGNAEIASKQVSEVFDAVHQKVMERWQKE